MSMTLKLKTYAKVKELGPRMAIMALLICLKMKMIGKVLNRNYSTNDSLLILCLLL